MKRVENEINYEFAIKVMFSNDHVRCMLFSMNKIIRQWIHRMQFPVGLNVFVVFRKYSVIVLFSLFEHN